MSVDWFDWISLLESCKSSLALSWHYCLIVENVLQYGIHWHSVWFSTAYLCSGHFAATAEVSHEEPRQLLVLPWVLLLQWSSLVWFVHCRWERGHAMAWEDHSYAWPAWDNSERVDTYSRDWPTNGQQYRQQWNAWKGRPSNIYVWDRGRLEIRFRWCSMKSSRKISRPKQRAVVSISSSHVWKQSRLPDCSRGWMKSPEVIFRTSRL